MDIKIALMFIFAPVIIFILTFIGLKIWSLQLKKTKEHLILQKKMYSIEKVLADYDAGYLIYADEVMKNIEIAESLSNNKEQFKEQLYKLFEDTKNEKEMKKNGNNRI